MRAQPPRANTHWRLTAFHFRCSPWRDVYAINNLKRVEGGGEGEGWMFNENLLALAFALELALEEYIRQRILNSQFSTFNFNRAQPFKQKVIGE